MASSIDATVSSGVAVSSDNSGILQFKSGGTTIATIGPTGLSTQVGAPAFSAYQSAITTLPAATWTKLQLNTKEYDTNNNYNTTNYRFTPTVAGYYAVTASWEGNSSTGTYNYIAIYKNGSSWKRMGYTSTLSGTTSAQISCQLYLNGSTDYIEAYGLCGAGTAADSSQAQTYFMASMIRSA